MVFTSCGTIRSIAAAKVSRRVGVAAAAVEAASSVIG
jgi:hypothetical protein